MEKINSIIAFNLTYLRKKSGLKQSDIAKKLNYSDKMISKWEKGDIVPSVENLCALCDIYGVSLDAMVRSKIEEADAIEATNKKRNKNNKIIITLLAVSVVWILATIFFVYATHSTSIKNEWLAFVYAVPVSCVVALVFNSIWGKPRLNYIIISVFIWTTITCFYLTFLKHNLFALYFIGIPAQISVILWSKLKIKFAKKSKKQTTIQKHNHTPLQDGNSESETKKED